MLSSELSKMHTLKMFRVSNVNNALLTWLLKRISILFLPSKDKAVSMSDRSGVKKFKNSDNKGQQTASRKS